MLKHQHTMGTKDRVLCLDHNVKSCTLIDRTASSDKLSEEIYFCISSTHETMIIGWNQPYKGTDKKSDFLRKCDLSFYIHIQQICFNVYVYCRVPYVFDKRSIICRMIHYLLHFNKETRSMRHTLYAECYEILMSISMHARMRWNYQVTISSIVVGTVRFAY